MAASSGTRSVRLLLLSLLGFCVALSHQESSSTDSCATAKVAVASLVPFDSTSFHCTAAWKQQDFVLRVCLLCCSSIPDSLLLLVVAVVVPPFLFIHVDRRVCSSSLGVLGFVLG
jgi:hypothetical protein